MAVFVEYYKKKGLEEETMKALKKGINTVIKQVHKKAVEVSPVDTGYLRNSLIYSLNGGTQYGANSKKIVTPSQLWDYKKGARGLGLEAELVDIGNLITFPKNTDRSKVIGYVGTNTKYSVYQEYGTARTPPQPFFRLAILTKGSNSEAKKVTKKYLQNALKLGKLELVDKWKA